jgi:L-threonine kinase
MRVTVAVPGTCGELVQGQLAGDDFLVSFPVNMFSKVTVELNTGGIIDVYPKWCTKVKLAVRNTLAYFNREDLGAAITISSQLPVGKGWASSSADIFGAISGVAIALNQELPTASLAQLALAIEPTDSIFTPGLAVFDHVKGTRLEPLGPALPLQVLACEFDDTVDTLSFNKRADLASLNKAKEAQVREALELVIQGVNEQDLKKVVRGATISAQAHQQILYKPYLNKIVKISAEYGSLGVNIAHSGTTVGILFPPEAAIRKEFVHLLKHQIPQIQQVHQLKAICGGIRCRQLSQTRRRSF